MADPENMGVTVGISFLAGIESEIRWGYFYPQALLNVTKNKAIL
jgi:hypothetical protein